MLDILSFKELLDVRKDIPKEYMRGTYEFHRSAATVSKYLVTNYANRIDARSIQKMRDELRQNEFAAKSINERIKLKERVLGCADRGVHKKDEAIVIARADKKAYRMHVKSAEVCRVESVLKCGFCIPAMKKTNYLGSFESEVKKGMMSRYSVKDYIVALVIICAKIAGAKPEMMSNVKVVEMNDGIVVNIMTSSGSPLKIIFRMIKDVFKMVATVSTKTTSVEISIKGDVK
jgi:hypothetical protein